MADRYLPPTPGGKWAIRRQIEGRWIDLIEDSYMDNPSDIDIVLNALKIAPTGENLNRYFPVRKGKGRCPTLELLELTNVLDPTNPVIRNKKEYGV